MEFRYVDDYVDRVHERFPKISKKAIKRILQFGLKSFYTHNLYGGDVLLKSPYFTLYSGRMFRSNLVFYKYWKIKYKIKFRIKYKRDKKQYDGYYYFGLSEEEYQDYKSQVKKSGRRRQKFTFKKVYAYKLLDECLLDRKNKHFFRFEFPTDVGFTFYKTDYSIKNFDYIAKRNSDKSIEFVNYEKRNK